MAAQFLDRLRNPKVSVVLKHPPTLGINATKIAFAPVSTECAEQIVDRLSGVLVARGIEVMERQNLQLILNEQNLGQSGLLNKETAVRIGQLLGPALLVILKVPTCTVEQRRNYSDSRTRRGIVRTYNAISEGFVRGSMQTVELATGRIFSASPLEITLPATNSSENGIPEFHSRQLIMDKIIEFAANEASKYFVSWSESRSVYFYNDRECNMINAYEMLKSGNYDEVVRLSEQGADACGEAVDVKPDKRSNALYNAGIAHLLAGNHAKAMSYLSQAASVRETSIIREAIAEASRSASLAAAAQRVVEKTERFEQGVAAAAVGTAAESQPAAVKAGPIPSGSLEERLKKLDMVFKQGLITKQEYESKKSQLLSEL